MLNTHDRWVAAGLIVLGLSGFRARAADDPPALEGPVAGEGGRVEAPTNALHEAFRTRADPSAPARAPTEPPAPIAERPTKDRPAAQALWVPGYWFWDAGRNDFVWVAGAWRIPPLARIWVSGRWVRDAEGWARVPGFWSPRQGRRVDPLVTASNWRQTGPPAATPADDPGDAPGPDAFLVPGHYSPQQGGVVWTPSYWARERPGLDWVPARWVRRPGGWDYRDGYWTRDPGRRVVARPRLEADADAGATPIPPPVVESQPAPAVEPGVTTVDPLPNDDGPPAPGVAPRGLAEAEVAPPAVVIRPPVVLKPPPYATPYLYPGTRSPYLVPPGYGPRYYDPLGVVPPFARRIIDRFVP